MLVISAAATAMHLYSEMTFGKTGNDNEIWSLQKVGSRPICRGEEDIRPKTRCVKSLSRQSECRLRFAYGQVVPVD